MVVQLPDTLVDDLDLFEARLRALPDALTLLGTALLRHEFAQDLQLLISGFDTQSTPHTRIITHSEQQYNPYKTIFRYIIYMASTKRAIC